jgi:DNA polymerase-1
VVALAALLPRLSMVMANRPNWLAHALLRGRYMKAAAQIEYHGVPLDGPMLQKLLQRWGWLKLQLIAEIRDEYPIFNGSVLKMDRFERWLAARRIPWPRTDTGRLSRSEDTCKTMCRAYPQLAPIREVRDNLSGLRLTDLAVGADGRNRTGFFCFGTRCGRNAPSNGKFIFGPSAWLRSLIRPGPGMALAYIDWSSQEMAIAAALSGDEAMIRAYRSGDPYLAFAKDAGLAPAEATKVTHKSLRDRCKAVLL